MMEPVVEPLAELVRRAGPCAARVPIISTVTGELLSEEEAKDPYYWARQARLPVLFLPALRTLWREPERLLLEVGPGTTSTTLAMQVATDRTTQVALASLADQPGSEWPALSAALGRAWLLGLPVDWEAVQSCARRQLCSLPSYPFARDRHWIDPPLESRPATGSSAESPAADLVARAITAQLDVIQSQLDVLARLGADQTTEG